MSSNNLDDPDMSLPEIEDISSYGRRQSLNRSVRKSVSNTITTTKTASNNIKSAGVSISDQIKKIQACKNEMRKAQNLLDQKKAMESELQSDGFMFDKMGQRREQTVDNVNLNEDQQRLIKQLTLKGEDTVSVTPSLEELFDINSLEVYRYSFSLDYCTDEYFNYLDQSDPLACEDIGSYISNLVDEERFTRFLNQIPRQELKTVVLDLFVLNACTLKDDLKIVSTFEILKSLICQDFDWYVSDLLVLKFFKSFGLNIAKLEAYLPNLLLEVDSSKLDYTELLHMSTQSTEFMEYIPRERINLLVDQFLTLLELSLDRRINAYKLGELDFIFLFALYLSFDATFHSEFNESNHLGNVLAGAMTGYSIKCTTAATVAAASDEVRMQSKQGQLRMRVSNFLAHDLESLTLGERTMRHQVATATDDDGDDIEMTQEEDQHQDSNSLVDLIQSNNIYHKFASLLRLLSSGRARLKRFIGSLASIAIANLVESAKCKYFKPITREPFLDDLLKVVEENCIQMYSNCSYTMFCLIELFGIVLDDLIFDMHENDENSLKLKIQCVNSIKEIAMLAKRNVRETGTQGRSQVKVCLDCFAWRIDFYAEKLNKELAMKSKDYKENIEQTSDEDSN